ncbi:MAG: hypothetical protein HYX27_27605 [Acidobacteria bacterium]|nr:hypothetical protein [Acidobacteriota bacterium]
MGNATRAIEARLREQYVPAIAFAHAYIGLGDSERVLESLEKAYQRREQGIAWLAVWEAHGPYRSDDDIFDLHGDMLKHVNLKSR